MKNRWSEEEAAGFVARYAPRSGEDLALRTYTSRLLGADPCLVLHGGGNSSVKSAWVDVLGQTRRALYVKASGQDMSVIEPGGHTALDLEYLLKLRALSRLADEAMLDELRTHLLRAEDAPPSIETLAHAFLPKKFVDHTHPDGILALTNQPEGENLAREALGDRVLVLGYVRPGFALAKAAAEAFEKNPAAGAMVLAHHGLITWGDAAQESYETTIDVVTRAERFLASRRSRASGAAILRPATPLHTARERSIEVAPLLRGLLAEPTSDADHPHRRLIVRPLVTREVLDFVDSDRGKELALTPPLTTDHLIRTKALPLWIDAPAYGDGPRLKEQISQAVAAYSSAYEAYFSRNAARMPSGVARVDSFPRVVLLPGLGALCAGKEAFDAGIVRDITAHTLAVKAEVAAIGSYRGLDEEHLFDMEYHPLQHAKLGKGAASSLSGHVTLVTGAAGAIGSGVCRELLEQGSHVAVTDLPGEALDNATTELQRAFGERALGTPLDVTDAGSVSSGFAEIIRTWGGVDLVVINAGIALAASLAEMDLEAFRRLERVNVEGTVLLLGEAARLFGRQGTGGDIVFVSSKNVFAPGASFGAYSATKTAAHQLARVASLELAPLGVRVNMVSPDAVFSEGDRKSGLWATVGPDRMRARGLDENGLEEYYRSRNLLKARITARHVARAVLFFATRQTPTTGATLPVDGGLPDATPR